MKTEYEIKLLAIDIHALDRQLTDAGFTKQPVKDFRRVVFRLPDDSAWARLRTDGRKTTLSYKLYENNAIDGVRELEVGVSDFDDTLELLQRLGHTDYVYQENRRTDYTSSESPLVLSIDEWPKVPPYLEVEGPDQASVEAFLTRLDPDGNYERTSQPTSAVYERAGLNINDYPTLKFD